MYVFVTVKIDSMVLFLLHKHIPISNLCTPPTLRLDTPFVHIYSVPSIR